jgi:hypothetical protein
LAIDVVIYSNIQVLVYLIVYSIVSIVVLLSNWMLLIVN